MACYRNKVNKNCYNIVCQKELINYIVLNYGGFMGELSKKVGKRIKQIRESQNIKQCVLAEKLNMEPSNLTRIESGYQLPKEDNLLKIAKILNVESARLERTSDVTTTTDIDMLEKSCRELIGKLLTVRQELKIGENMYVGESKGGIPDGEGLMRFSEDDPEGRKSYKGSWLNGKCHGKGTMAYTGGVYIGNFNAGTRSGFGIFSYLDGSRYEGNWVNDKMDGNGRFYYAKDDLDSRHFLNGYWKNGIITGEGRLFYKNGNYKVGIFVNGRMDGEWKCYDLYGTHIANQIFKNGIPVKTKRLNKK